ncbi:MAG: flippase [Candidatus Colwellbacteria bacterium]|nr:flippase [Candidatus Colwellbacteria bacterium]
MFKKIKSVLLENRSVRQTVAKNTFWLIGGEAAGQALRFLIVVYAARILGAEAWGAFSYAIALAIIFNIVGDLGIGVLFTREAIKKPEIKDQYLSTAFFIKAAFLVFAALIIILTSPFVTKIEAVRPLLPLVALLLVFDGLREFGYAVNRAREEMQWEATVKIFTHALAVILGFAVLFVSPTPSALASSYVVASLAGFLLMVWLLRKDFKEIFKNFSKILVKPIIQAAWPLALLGILGGIILQSGVLMLGWLKAAGEVGIFSAAQRPVQLLYIFPLLIAVALFPTFTRLIRRGRMEFARELLEEAIAYLSAVALPICIAGVILADDLVLFFFGREYLATIPSFQILLLTLPLVFPAAVIADAVLAYDRQKVFMKLLAFAALLNIILNLLLIPPLGEIGAALSVLITFLFIYLFAWRGIKKIISFSVLAKLKRPVFASVLMTLGLLLGQAVGFHPSVNLGLSVAVYLAALVPAVDLWPPIKRWLKINEDGTR